MMLLQLQKQSRRFGKDKQENFPERLFEIRVLREFCSK